ncbi:MBL fold metallo-hydrolase [Photobacterium sp. R1]
MIIHVLADNQKIANRTDLKAEKGLSYHVSTGACAILFDVGGGQTFLQNARQLDLDIARVDVAVLSHRHHDHGNGLPVFLRENQHARVCLRACPTESYFFKYPIFKYTALQFEVGLDVTPLEVFKDRLWLIRQTTEICPNVFCVVNISEKYPRPAGNRYLFAGEKHSLRPDPFEHELFMIIQEPDGLVIFTGCAHSGVLNMIETAVEMFPGVRIKAVVGGFHLVGLPLFNTLGGSEADIRKIGEQLSAYPIVRLYTGHCTGMKAFRILKQVLGDRIEHIPTGSCLRI